MKITKLLFIFLMNFAIAFGAYGKKSSSKAKKPKEEKHFSGSFGLGYSQGFSPFAEGSIFVGIGLNYALPQGFSVGSSFSGYFDHLENNQDLSQFHLDDVSLGIGKGEIWKHKKRGTNLGGGIAFTLPTSRASKDSKKSLTITGFSTLSQGVGPLSLSLTGKYHYYNYKSGAPAGKVSWVAQSIFGLSFKAADRLNLIASGVYSYVKNSDKEDGEKSENDKVIAYSFNATIKVMKNLSANFGVSTKNKVISTENLFNEDNTSYSASLTYTF